MSVVRPSSPRRSTRERKSSASSVPVVSRLFTVISMSGSTSRPWTAGSCTNCAVAQLSMSTLTRVTGRKLPRSTSTALWCSASEGCSISPRGPNITALVSPLCTRWSEISRLSTCAKAGPRNEIMSTSTRAAPTLSTSDSTSRFGSSR